MKFIKITVNRTPQEIGCNLTTGLETECNLKLFLKNNHLFETGNYPHHIWINRKRIRPQEWLTYQIQDGDKIILAPSLPWGPTPFGKIIDAHEQRVRTCVLDTICED